MLVCITQTGIYDGGHDLPWTRVLWRHSPSCSGFIREQVMTMRMPHGPDLEPDLTAADARDTACSAGTQHAFHRAPSSIISLIPWARPWKALLQRCPAIVLLLHAGGRYA